MNQNNNIYTGGWGSFTISTPVNYEFLDEVFKFLKHIDELSPDEIYDLNNSPYLKTWYEKEYVKRKENVLKKLTKEERELLGV